MSDPFPCLRHLFEIPDGISYLDAAAWSPLPRVVREAGEAGIRTKSQPWSYARDENLVFAKRARAAAAAMIGAESQDIAIVGSVSHAVATAARNLALPPGGRILRVADEFPSLCFAFDRLAAERGLVVETVPRPADADWTAALMEAIARPGAAPLAVATLTPLHWTDGTVIDLDQLAPAVRATGAALVVDATQAVGAVSIDVARLRPDFLTFPTYKWALGPYGLAFLYAAPDRQEGVPLEDNNGNRAPAAGARRYDKGEVNDPVALRMAAAGLELIAGWRAPALERRPLGSAHPSDERSLSFQRGGASDRTRKSATFASDALAVHLRGLTDRLAVGATAQGLNVLPRALRAPHILSLRIAGGLPPGSVERLKERGIFVSARAGGLRLSPFVWTNDADIELFLNEVGAALRP